MGQKLSVLYTLNASTPLGADLLVLGVLPVNEILLGEPQVDELRVFTSHHVSALLQPELEWNWNLLPLEHFSVLLDKVWIVCRCKQLDDFSASSVPGHRECRETAIGCLVDGDVDNALKVVR